MNLIQIANSISMIFPLIAWWKNRKKYPKSIMNKLLIIHTPVSFIYHTVCAFRSNFRLLQFADYVLIHLTSLITGNHIVKNCHPILRFITQTMTYPIHTKACLDVFFNYENINLRFFAIILNNIPLIWVYPFISFEIITNCVLSYKLYTFKSGAYHPLFHALLLHLYNKCYEVL